MKKIFGNWWFLTGLAALLLVLVFCWGVPYFVSALRPVWVRIALFLLFLLYVLSGYVMWLWRLFAQRRAG